MLNLIDNFLSLGFHFLNTFPLLVHSEIDWNSLGISSLKLDYLGFYFGYFHEAHRAKADVDMLITVLNGDLKSLTKNRLKFFIRILKKHHIEFMQQTCLITIKILLRQVDISGMQIH